MLASVFYSYNPEQGHYQYLFSEFAGLLCVSKLKPDNKMFILLSDVHKNLFSILEKINSLTIRYEFSLVQWPFRYCDLRHCDI